MTGKYSISTLLLSASLTVGFAATDVLAGEEAAAPKAAVKKFDVADGKKVFETNCASCHGTTGKGDGAAAAALNPKPRNLADAKYMSSRSWEDLHKVVAEGGGNSGFSPLMPAWKGILKKAQLDNVLAYVVSLSGNSAKADAAAAKAAEKAAAKKPKAE